MGRLDEQASARFLTWERRTRGWPVYPCPVSPEPPFARFPGRQPAVPVVVDDGKRTTALGGLWQGLWRSPAVPPAPGPEEPEEVTVLEREHLIELPLYLPREFNTKGPEFAAFTHSLVSCQEPVAYETRTATS